MHLPLTEEYLQKIEVEMEKEEGKPMTEHRKKHARIVAELINQAYWQGIDEGIILAQITVKESQSNG